MTKEQIKEYTLRITQANRSEMIIIIYDMILDDIKEAKSAINHDEYKKACSHITRCIAHLINALDFSYPISLNYVQIYLYLNRTTSMALIKNDPALLDEVAYRIETLRESFNEVCRQDKSSAMMENTQTVYAGLTYGKTALNESLNDQGALRGFRV
ncbi:MAG: flagellar protein FliS [Clostridia bacterium]|nr:flagellar protein FliS [Clostridia bacterium]